MPEDAPLTDFRFSLNLAPNAGLTDEARHNREIILLACQKLAAGDVPGFAAHLDPDIAFYEAPSLPYGQEAHGIEEAMNGVSKMMETWSAVAAEVQDALASGDLVILYMNLRNVSRMTGKVYEGMLAEVFRLRNAKIIEWRPIYWDTHAVRTVCGLN